MWLVAAVVATAFVVQAAPRLAAPLGDSHDGRNAGAWGLGARALVDDPIGSRLGAVRPDGTPYANHPPAIVAATALTSLATGDRPLGLRLPAVLATVAALALLVVLLRDQGVGPVPASVALIVAGTTGMLLTYGSMLDTPVLALPTAVAALIAIGRVRAGTPVRPSLLLAVGVAAGLTSWSGCVLVAIAAAGALPGGRARRARLRPLGLLVGGAVAGGLVSLAWAWWGYGDLATLWRTLSSRSDQPGSWWAVQREASVDLYGPVVLALVVVGSVVALVRRRHRLVLGASVVPVLVWARAMAGGASVHDYWNYLGIVAVAVAAAVVAEACLDAAEGSEDRRLRPLVAGALGLAAVAVAARSLATPSFAEYTIRLGIDAGRAVDQLDPAPGPAEPVVWIDGATVPGGGLWASWSGQGTAPTVPPGEIGAVAAEGPDRPLLVALPFGAEPTQKLLDIALARSGRYVVVPASLLAGPR